MKSNNKGKGVHQHIKTMKVIYACVENGDLKRLKLIQNIEHYINLEYTDYGWNMVHLAAWFKQIDILKYILETQEGRNLINAVDKFLFIPIDLNYKSRILIKEENNQEQNLETPLHLAFFTEGKECIQLLIEHGADPQQENILHQVPLQTMTAPRENQYQTLLDIKKTITNDSLFNSINPYIQKLKQELEVEKFSTTIPIDGHSKTRQNDVNSPNKSGNQILEDDYQFLNTNKNSQKQNSRDMHLLSFQSASNNFNDEIIGLSNFSSQQYLNQNGQSKLESIINSAKKRGSEVDLQEERLDTDEQIPNIKAHQNQKKHCKTSLDDSEIQDERKSINLNYFQTRIRQFTEYSVKNS